MASTSAVFRSPPALVPSAPAGKFTFKPRGGQATGSMADRGIPDVRIARDRGRGRGTLSNQSGRYEPIARIAFDDGWQSLEELPPFATTVSIDATRKIITRNQSPDISFD